jgi:hypothetical protein
MRLPSRFNLALVATITVAAHDVAAQGPVQAGSRVRVTARQLVVPVIGSFQTVRRDTIVVLEEGVSASIWNVPVANVQRFELSAGIRGGDGGRAVKFALWGGVSGAALGLLTSVILQNSTGDRYDKGASAGVGAGVGALILGLVGYRHAHEEWTLVPLTRLPRATSLETSGHRTTGQPE